MTNPIKKIIANQFPTFSVLAKFLPKDKSYILLSLWLIVIIACFTFSSYLKQPLQNITYLIFQISFIAYPFFILFVKSSILVKGVICFASYTMFIFGGSALAFFASGLSPALNEHFQRIESGMGYFGFYLIYWVMFSFLLIIMGVIEKFEKTSTKKK